MFFTVSGGPFGLEGLVGTVGPGVALLLLFATPLLYSVPETLLIGEIASMLPVEGGYYQWVKRAFGRGWGFWNGWLSWIYSLIDMAIYPVLFLQYLQFFLPELSRLEACGVALVLIWGAAWIALAGMLSAFALFNALLLAYSRIPLVVAQDGLLPAALARVDERGTPRNAVLVSAVAYSGFALLSFGGLLAADVLLYSAAL